MASSFAVAQIGLDDVARILSISHRVPTAAPRDAASGMPELRLFAVLLVDAATLVTGSASSDHAHARDRAAAEARAWVRQGDVGAVSFNEVCGWLNLDVQRTRERILRRRRSCGHVPLTRRDNRT